MLKWKIVPYGFFSDLPTSRPGAHAIRVHANINLLYISEKFGKPSDVEMICRKMLMKGV